MSEKIPLYLTPAEMDHIASCIDHRDVGHDAGWYYGNKEDFEKRHTRLRVLIGLTPTPGEKP